MVLVALAAVAIGAPLLAPFDPRASSGPPVAGPDLVHLFGTNDVGQDLFSEWLWAARASIAIALAATLISCGLSWTVGLLAGFVRRLDAPVMAVSDLVLALPALPLYLVVLTLIGPSQAMIALVVGLLSWPAFARIVRAQVFDTRSREFVEAARALGASPARIVRLHILPATLGLVPAKLLITLRLAVFGEATLAFLGVSDPAAKSWGATLGWAFNDPLLFARPTWGWWVLPPAGGILVLIVCATWLSLSLTAGPSQARKPSVEKPHRLSSRPLRAFRQPFAEAQVVSR
jgi:ABC-type dipeptide/oligopeptide/nickel transport system permease subunit